MNFVSLICFLQYLPARSNSVAALVRAVKSRGAVKTAVGRDLEHGHAAELLVVDHSVRFLNPYVVHETAKVGTDVLAEHMRHGKRRIVKSVGDVFKCDFFFRIVVNELDYVGEFDVCSPVLRTNTAAADDLTEY